MSKSKSRSGVAPLLEEGDLPDGWSYAELGKIATVGPKKTKPEIADDSQMAFVPMPRVAEEFGGIDVSQTRPLGEVHKGYTQFREGDVLFAKITPCMENGKLAIVPQLESEYGYGSTEFHVIRNEDGAYITKWLAYFLSQQSLRRQAQREMTGSAGQLRVPRPWLQELKFPIAPLPEQKRIVSKIEELFSDLDAGVSALERARANLRRYRASVLKSAVEGRLTQKWRRANPDVEPASELLARILRERRERWEQQQLTTYESKGKKPPKNWQIKYKEPAAPDTANLPQLPNGWRWATVQQVGDVQLGRQRSPKHHNGPHMRPYLRVANVFEDRIDIVDVMEMNFTPDEFERYKLSYGDILLNEGQSHELVGRPAMYRDEVPGSCFTNTLVRFKSTDGVDRDFALRVFLAYLKNGRFQDIASITVNLAHLGAGRFAELEFPLPPINEQFEIIRIVDEQITSIDASEKLIGVNLKRAQRLRQAILKQAFRGMLVPQNDLESDKKLAATGRSEPYEVNESQKI